MATNRAPLPLKSPTPAADDAVMEFGFGTGTSRRRPRAGGSALTKFRESRRAEIRTHWRDWLTLIGGIVASLVLTIVTHGLTQLVFAGITGALITVVVVGWMIGGHVRSLPWVWGAEGERDTAAVLDELGEGWECVHDLPGSAATGITSSLVRRVCSSWTRRCSRRPRECPTTLFERGVK
jgi:hypothetical protein